MFRILGNLGKILTRRKAKAEFERMPTPTPGRETYIVFKKSERNPNVPWDDTYREPAPLEFPDRPVMPTKPAEFK